MSAYMVDREHVRYLVHAAVSRRLNRHHGSNLRWADKCLTCQDYDEMSRVGQMLWDENLKSINYRYPDTVDNMDNAPGPIGESYVYGKHQPYSYVDIDPVQVLMSCHCYEYQSCEHPGWADSEAKQFIDALEKSAVRALVGYEDCKWGAPESCYQSLANAR